MWDHRSSPYPRQDESVADGSLLELSHADLRATASGQRWTLSIRSYRKVRAPSVRSFEREVAFVLVAEQSAVVALRYTFCVARPCLHMGTAGAPHLLTGSGINEHCREPKDS
jgi:hypothetical protein